MSLKNCKHSDIKVSWEDSLVRDKMYTMETTICNYCGKVLDKKVNLSYIPSNKSDK